jgi:hypothetical protein
MNLHDINRPKVIERALLATDLGGSVIVLATDSAGIADTVDQVSTDADECGLIDASVECQEPGLYLWEGTSRLEYENYEATTPTELVYEGTVRAVRPDEVAVLYAMSPPEDA